MTNLKTSAKVIFLKKTNLEKLKTLKKFQEQQYQISLQAFQFWTPLMDSTN